MVAVWNRADQYIFPCGFFLMAALRSRCGHYIPVYITLILWFLSIYLLLPFSSPNLSGRRMDVYCNNVVCISIRITGTCTKLAQTQIRNISSSIITVTRFQLHIYITSTTRTRRLNLSRNYTTLNVT